MVDVSCDRCEKYNEDCMKCRHELIAQKVINFNERPTKEQMFRHMNNKDGQTSRAYQRAHEQNLHPQDAGKHRRVASVGITNEGNRVYAQGAFDYPNEETGAPPRTRPTFAGIPFATDERQMKNPAANIFRRGNPMKIAWRLLKDEYACPKCSGAGSFDDDGDEITCFDCKGTGSIEPTHHPGADNKGAVSMTAVDIREPTHVEQYDVENAMPLEGSMPKITTTGQVIDPKRQAFSRDGNMKQTRQVIAPQGTVDNTHPDLRHRLPSVYMRERDENPSNAGLNITGDPSRGGTPLFQRGNSMTVTWRLLKNG